MTAGTATLVVSGQDPARRRVSLEPKGMVVGRSTDCDLVLDSLGVSRHHARIFQDPFGRWIVEDLGSRNGLWLEGERVSACALLPGKRFALGHFLLSLSQEPTREIAPDSSVKSTTTILEDGLSDIMALGEAKTEMVLSHAGLKQLNATIERLAEVSSPAELYPEVCGCLAEEPETAAVVLRLPAEPQPLPSSPEIFAGHFGGESEHEPEDDTRELHLSRRVLEAVRSADGAVMATNARSSAKGLKLTVDDGRTPRTVFCCPIARSAETVEVLYLDVPAEGVGPDTEDFVRAVAQQVNFARKNLLLAEERAEMLAIEEQLSWAHDIQLSLIPDRVEGIEGVDVATCYQPVMWVGGDYCDMWALPDGRLVFVIGDVSGKGLPAAMVMTNLRAALRTTMSFCPEPTEAMEHIARHLDLPEDMFITLFLGLFDPSSGKLEYVNAGHVPPLKVLPNRRTTVFAQATGPPLGALEAPFDKAEETVEGGAALVAVTDGITEAASPSGELFGIERLQELMETTEARSAEDMVESVTRAAGDFRQQLPQQDDVTVLALLRDGEQA